MHFSLYCLFLFIVAAKGFAFPFVVNKLQDSALPEKISQDLSLARQILSERTLYFDAEQDVADPSILELSKQLGLTSLLDLLVRAGLINQLSGPGPFTVLGPTNEAFNKLPAWTKDLITNNTLLASVLLFHVLPKTFYSRSIKDELLVHTALGDKQLRLNIYEKAGSDSVVTAQCAPLDFKKVDNKATNGLIHVLNSVMIPPFGNIIESASACPVFKTLVAALKATDLVQVLSGEDPFTLFAPTDKAFQKLPPDFLNWLMKNTTALKLVLEYHIVPLTYCTAGLLTGFYCQITTLANQNITIRVSSGEVKVNNAIMTLSDGSVSNGVIHALDTVLIPVEIKLV